MNPSPTTSMSESDAQQVAEEEPAEEVGEETLKEKPKSKFAKTNKGKKKAAPLKDEIIMAFRMPRIVHDELKRLAMKNGVPMGRLLMVTFADSLPPEVAQRLSVVIGPLSTTSRRLVAGQKASDRNAHQACKHCRKTHPNMPGLGPWHMPECPMWRQRASVVVDGEKEP